MMPDLLRSLNEIDESSQESSIGTQKCDKVDLDDDADGDMIPMCRPCFSGDTIKSRLIIKNNYTIWLKGGDINGF